MGRKLLSPLSARVIQSSGGDGGGGDGGGGDNPTRVGVEDRGSQAAWENPCVEVRALKTTPAFEAESSPAFDRIRVFRSAAPDFEFGGDYAEYFNGMTSNNAEVIYENRLEPENERAFTYIDEDVEPGTTYCYWMAGAEGEPTGPVAVKVRDPAVWWPYEHVLERIDDLQTAYPGLVRSETIGRTVRGLPIRAVTAGTGTRTVEIIGAVHGGEAGPELGIGALEILLREQQELLERVSLTLVPTVNIDERERLVAGVPWYLRTNAVGVDLNRNFPASWYTVELGYGNNSSVPGAATYRGPFPASEPETRAVMDHLRRNPPEVVLAFHCLASICGMSLITARDAESDTDYAGRCEQAARAYVNGSGIEVQSDKAFRFVCTSGSLAAWCWQELNVPAFDLEISAAAEPEAYEMCKRDRTDRDLITRYQRIHAGSLASLIDSLPHTRTKDKEAKTQ